jgi:hypothetical protein
MSPAQLRIGAALLTAAACLVGAPPCGAETRALIVGINVYASANPLLGAVNDARDLDGVLAKRGVKDRALLLDAAATRAAFDKAWSDLLARSARGDVIVFAFAGHGIRVPERGGLRRTPDGYDKGFILHGYEHEKRPGEILRDEELYDLFQAAATKGIKVVFVADACHSGAAVRGTDALRTSGLPTRVHRFDLQGQEPPPPPALPAAAAGRPPIHGVTIYSATVEQLPVKEVAIDGRPRGALSYAIARGLEGGTEPGGRPVTAEGLKRYVVPVVIQHSANTQAPQFLITEPNLELLAPTGGARVALPDLREVRLTVLGGSVRVPQGAVLTPDRALADLLFDPARRQLLNGRGDVLASGLAESSLQPAVDARRVLDALTRTMQAPATALQTRLFAPGEQRPAGADRIYLKGETVQFELETSDLRFPTVFSIAANGIVQFQWPIASQGDPLEWTRPEPFGFAAPVSPPFGADTLVFIATPAPLPDLHRRLMALHNRAAPLDAWQAVRAALGGTRFKLGLQAAYTCERLENGLCDTMLASAR